MPDVVVVGAGPVGMFLAGELSRRGVDVEVLERRPTSGGGTRAIGLHAPVLAAFEPSGLTERMLDRAVQVRRGQARADGELLGIVPFERLSTRFPFVATLAQAETEALLAERAPAVRRGVTVRAVRAAGGGGMRLETDEGDHSCRIAVVASGWGGRDLVFRPEGLSSHTYPDRYVMADLAVPPRSQADEAVVHLSREGVLESFPLPDGVRRFVAWDPGGPDHPEALNTRLRTALEHRGEAEAAASVVSASAFAVRRVLAPRQRRERLFVIGDAAHEVSPIGGQGMNLGLLDAAGLAPLLVSWVATGVAPEPELLRWERARLRSARTAARIAALNTGLGRPAGVVGQAVRRATLRGLLNSPARMLLAHAYAMGLDSGS